MAALKLHQFGTVADVSAFLRGDISGGTIPSTIWGLDGLTLEFTTPLITVTFAMILNSARNALTLPEIAAQVTAGLGAGYEARIFENRLVVAATAPSAGIVLAGTGTANTHVGFNPAGAAGVTYGAPDGVAPRLISLSQPAGSNSFLVVTEE